MHRLLQAKATAKSNSLVGFRLVIVLSAGDIIGQYCPKTKELFSSTLTYPGNRKNSIRYAYHTALQLSTMYVRALKGVYDAHISTINSVKKSCSYFCFPLYTTI